MLKCKINDRYDEHGNLVWDPNNLVPIDPNKLYNLEHLNEGQPEIPDFIDKEEKPTPRSMLKWIICEIRQMAPMIWWGKMEIWYTCLINRHKYSNVIKWRNCKTVHKKEDYMKKRVIVSFYVQGRFRQRNSKSV